MCLNSLILCNLIILIYENPYGCIMFGFRKKFNCLTIHLVGGGRFLGVKKKKVLKMKKTLKRLFLLDWFFLCCCYRHHLASSCWKLFAKLETFQNLMDSYGSVSSRNWNVVSYSLHLIKSSTHLQIWIFHFQRRIFISKCPFDSQP